MNLKNLSQLFSFRDLRNAVLGLIVVFGGIGLSFLTLYAHETGDSRLAGISAAASLIFVLLLLIFVVPPLARNAGKEASQMNLPFEFTVGGAIMLGLIAIVGFSAWNTGNNLLFLVLSFLTAAMVVGFAAGNSTLKKLDVKMRFPETIFAGENTSIHVSLYNRKRVFPVYSVVAEVRGMEREESSVLEELEKILPKRLARRLARPPINRRTLDHFVYVPRNSMTENTADHVFERRGRFLIKDFEISTRFPFGFFRHRRRLPARETELIVFPKIKPFDHELENLTLESGSITSQKRGLGQDLLALREYQPNDDLRRIDWKATARARQLTVREFTAEDEKRVAIYFDTRIPESDEPRPSLRERVDAEQNGKGIVISKRFERGVSTAASLLAHFADEQAEIRFVIDKDAADGGFGKRHLYQCLRKLAIVEPKFDVVDVGEKLSEIFDARENTHNFLVTAMDIRDFPDEITANVVLVQF